MDQQFKMPSFFRVPGGGAAPQIGDQARNAAHGGLIAALCRHGSGGPAAGHAALGHDAGEGHRRCAAHQAAHMGVSHPIGQDGLYRARSGAAR